MYKTIFSAATMAALAITSTGVSAQEAEPRTTLQERQPAAQQQRQGVEQQRDRFEQQRGQTQQLRQAQPQTAQARSQRGLSNEEIAEWLKIGNQVEIQLSQLAQRNSENPQVKEFAQQMMQEHSQFAQRLDQASQSRGQVATSSQRDRTGQPAQDGQRQRSEQVAGSDQQRGEQTARIGERSSGEAAGGRSVQERARASIDPGRTGSQSSELLSLKQELAQQCIQSTNQMLGEKRGREFDKAFVGMQVAMHKNMLDELKVLQRHASGELQQVIDEGIQSTQQHLQHAIALMEQIDSADQGAGQSRQGERQPESRQPQGRQPGQSGAES